MAPMNGGGRRVSVSCKVPRCAGVIINHCSQIANRGRNGKGHVTPILPVDHPLEERHAKMLVVGAPCFFERSPETVQVQKNPPEDAMAANRLNIDPPALFFSHEYQHIQLRKNTETEQFERPWHKMAEHPETCRTKGHAIWIFLCIDIVAASVGFVESPRLGD